jgi:hypothetical protein
MYRPNCRSRLCLLSLLLEASVCLAGLMMVEPLGPGEASYLNHDSNKGWDFGLKEFEANVEASSNFTRPPIRTVEAEKHYWWLSDTDPSSHFNHKVMLRKLDETISYDGHRCL